MISTAQIVYNITAVCTYPILGKVADLLGRGEGFGLTVMMYTLAYVLFAACNTVCTYLAGQVFFALGTVGFKTYVLIFIADTTNLINRGLWSQLPSAITGISALYAGSYIQDAFLEHSTWRCAYGSFAIILGISAIPLTLVMLWVDSIQKRSGARRKAMILDNLPEGSLWTKVKSILFIEMDIIGGFLLLSCTILFFIRFTITGKSSPNKWGDASTIVMVIIGFFLLVVFCLLCYFTQFFPWFKTRLPFIPIRSFKNHTILIAFRMVALDYCENACFNVYFSATLQVGGYLSAGEAARVNNAKKVSIDIASILTGLTMKYTKSLEI
jgi:MFS family permease